MKMEGIEEPLDRRGSFIEERVVRVPRFNDCPDLDLCDEDAEVLEDFGAGETCCLCGVLFQQGEEEDSCCWEAVVGNLRGNCELASQSGFTIQCGNELSVCVPSRSDQSQN